MTAANIYREDTVARTLRTNKNGEASFVLERRGHWIFTTTHVVPLANVLGVEWRTYVASLTFGF